MDDLIKRAHDQMDLEGYGESYDVFEELVAALEAVDARYRKLVALLDDLLGTPCEQVRHQQEIEAKNAEIIKAHQDAEDMAGKCLRQRAVIKAARNIQFKPQNDEPYINLQGTLAALDGKKEDKI